MEFQNLLIEQKGRIRYIIINRESKLNALNAATMAELHTALAAAMDDEATGGMILTGAGIKAFVAGADISEFKEVDFNRARQLATDNQKNIFNLIAHSTKPVIAAINGFALGGGLELALACHIRIAAETAKMGLPEVTLGLIPGYGGTQRLTALIGRGKALELILTADMITAAEAAKIGLVNHVVTQEDLRKTAEGILNKILLRASLAVSAAIRAVNALDETGTDGYAVEINEFAGCFSTSDIKEGINAFEAKRPPVFTGK